MQVNVASRAFRWGTAPLKVSAIDEQTGQVAPLGGELVAAAGIIAAIIDTHTAAKNANEPSRVWAPMSIPVICRTATTQHAAASPSVAVSAAGVAAAARSLMIPSSFAVVRSTVWWGCELMAG